MPAIRTRETVSLAERGNATRTVHERDPAVDVTVDGVTFTINWIDAGGRGQRSYLVSCAPSVGQEVGVGDVVQDHARGLGQPVTVAVYR